MKSKKWIAATFVLLGAAAIGAQGTSKWVYPDAKGGLKYTADARGNRISDGATDVGEPVPGTAARSIG